MNHHQTTKQSPDQEPSWSQMDTQTPTLDLDLFKVVDSSIQKSIWTQARDSLKDFMFNNFLPGLNFANQLNDISRGLPEKSNKPRWNLSMAEVAPAYVRLGKLMIIQEDGLRFLPRLEQFLIQTPGRFLLEKELFNKLSTLINRWISTLYYCKYGQCHENCICLEETFSKIMKLPPLRNMNFQQLVTKELPGHTFRNRIFGNIVNRALEILEEVEKQLPTYEQIYHFNTVPLLNLLTFNKTCFQITQRDGCIHINIDNSNDKFHVRTLRANQFPKKNYFKK